MKRTALAPVKRCGDLVLHIAQNSCRHWLVMEKSDSDVVVLSPHITCIASTVQSSIVIVESKQDVPVLPVLPSFVSLPYSIVLHNLVTT